MRILLTNNTLDARAGTELYLCEIAEALLAAGHEPMCFSLKLGAQSDRLLQLGIPVSDDLRALPGPPDVIHGQHIIETTLAAMTYRRVPVISVCHSPEAWQESACRLPNVVRWIVVDQDCRRRWVEEENVDAARVTVLLNHFDNRKFHPRSPLPAKPRRALLASNYLVPEHPAVLAARAACEARGIELCTVGTSLGGNVENLETLFPEFDLVFAKGRVALEAAAVGCAVMQLEFFGAGHLARTENYDELRDYNFGYHTMRLPLDAEVIGREMDRYDPVDAALFSQRIREEATLEKTMASLIPLYAEAAAMAGSLTDYDPMIAGADFLRFQLHLSKIPMDSLRKTQGVPLRLPSFPVGNLQKSWEAIAAQHQTFASLRLAARQGERKEKMEALRSKHADLLARHSELFEKYKALKNRPAPAPPKPPLTFFQKLRRLLSGAAD
ncbi:MAG: glycosyltransferase [Chthoniobacterales bacterium]